MERNFENNGLQNGKNEKEKEKKNGKNAWQIVLMLWNETFLPFVDLQNTSLDVELEVLRCLWIWNTFNMGSGQYTPLHNLYHLCLTDQNSETLMNFFHFI